jgi:glycerol-3-phosphate acyltransferase PlsX
VDVIVTDGFTGNVALKTAEGLARFFSNEIKTTLTSSPLAMLGAVIASGALGKMRQRLDPSRVNGAPLLGLNGIVVKSHGGADAVGFFSALRVAADLARSDFTAEIDRNLKRLTAITVDEGVAKVGEAAPDAASDGASK